MTYGAHFRLNGFVNKQNFRYWRVEDLIILSEKELHPQCVTVWCVITCDLIVDPYFFENVERFTEIVNGEKYRHILNIFLSPVIIHLRNRHELWFQQDGATFYTANETMDVLQEMFGNNIIPHRAALTWPPTSDLSYPYYYIWGYLKEATSIGRITWKI